eukprot:GHVU01019072.1.p1 GENE.GHVU01019072.1~~GHVU01019072.1.p1  ORF type:complete len:166 (+),score=4.01 GHVU01019072.1:348-845(+)
MLGEEWHTYRAVHAAAAGWMDAASRTQVLSSLAESLTQRGRLGRFARGGPRGSIAGVFCFKGLSIHPSVPQGFRVDCAQPSQSLQPYYYWLVANYSSPSSTQPLPPPANHRLHRTPQSLAAPTSLWPTSRSVGSQCSFGAAAAYTYFHWHTPLVLTQFSLDWLPV